MTNIIKFQDLPKATQEAVTYASSQQEEYNKAKALVKAYDLNLKAVKAFSGQFTDQGEDVTILNPLHTPVITLKCSKMSTTKNFKINIKALYASWKNSEARETLSSFFTLTFVPKKGFSESAISQAETAALKVQLQGHAGHARQENPEAVFDRVLETYRVSVKVL